MSLENFPGHGFSALLEAEILAARMAGRKIIVEWLDNKKGICRNTRDFSSLAYTYVYMYRCHRLPHNTWQRNFKVFLPNVIRDWKCSICHSLFLSFQFPTNESCVFERVHCFLTENQKTSGKHTVWDDNSEGTESQTLFSTATFLIFYRGMLAGVDSQQYSAQSDFPPLISLFSKYPEPLHVTLSSDQILPNHPSPTLHLGHLPELGMTYTPLFHSAVSVFCGQTRSGKILILV